MRSLKYVAFYEEMYLFKIWFMIYKHNERRRDYYDNPNQKP